MLYEFFAPNPEAMNIWIKAINKAISSTPNESCFAMDNRKAKFKNGEVFDLNNSEDRQRLIAPRPCACGNAAVHTCACQIQAYCSTNCEVAHTRYHSPVCIKDLVPPKPL